MGSYVRDLYAGHQNPVDFMMSNITAAVVGTLVMREPTASNSGEVAIATTTAALNALGCAADVDTYSTTQGAAMGLIRVMHSPFAVWKFRVSGSSTKGAALSSAAGGQIMTNTVAETSGLVITSVVPTTDFSGGIIKGRTGANKGSIRKQTSRSSGVSATVVVPFPNDIAVDDSFIAVPYSRAAIAVQMVATTIDEADGSIAFGTGVPLNVEYVTIDEDTDQAWVEGCLRTHMHNSLA
jgi:hypothetical protein